MKLHSTESAAGPSSLVNIVCLDRPRLFWIFQSHAFPSSEVWGGTVLGAPGWNHAVRHLGATQKSQLLHHHSRGWAAAATSSTLSKRLGQSESLSDWLQLAVAAALPPQPSCNPQKLGNCVLYHRGGWMTGQWRLCLPSLHVPFPSLATWDPLNYRLLLLTSIEEEAGILGVPSKSTTSELWLLS